MKAKMALANDVVLGSIEMAEVKADLIKTEFPSWIQKAPKNMGLTSHGKLSADEWRVACTIHYPITLIRLWGADQPATKQNSRYLQVLDNFMHLILATSLSARRSTTPYLRERILWHTEHYLSGLRTLFPGVKIQPNDHLALHFPSFLELFGPPHGWWAFPTERFIGVLQRLGTNSRFGMGRHFHLQSDPQY